MENAVKQLEEVVRGIESKLDTMNWKLEEFEKGVINLVKNKPNNSMVSVMGLMLQINNIRDDYNTLSDELLAVEESRKDIKTNLTEQITTVTEEFIVLKNLLKSSKKSP